MTENVHFKITKHTMQQDKKLIETIAENLYSDCEVYVSNWDDFLSNFDVLTDVSYFSVNGLPSTDVTSPFVNLKPIAVAITFNCSDKIASYIEEYIENKSKSKGKSNKYIGIAQPVSVGFSTSKYTSLFITDIDVEKSTLYREKDVVYDSFNSIKMVAYTFRKTPHLVTSTYYVDGKAVVEEKVIE